MNKRFFLEDFISKRVTGRQKSLFREDIDANHKALADEIAGKAVLVIGGAGTIGASFIKAILPFKPEAITVVDNNENGLAELVRDLRSNAENVIPQSFITYPMDLASKVFKKIVRSRHFDIIANFAAHKHVRSEKDQYSVEAMITNNVLSAHYLLNELKNKPPAHFFCVSTDKAANPINIMGASKKLMEEVIFNYLECIPVTTARFANVAFSDGSLLDGFLERIKKRQPISAPHDVKRYFISPEEAGEICLLSCILGNSGEILFPKLAFDSMRAFSEIAVDLLSDLGYVPYVCKSEQEAKLKAKMLNAESTEYPIYFFSSDTTGERAFEEFITDEEYVDWNRFKNLGVIKNSSRHSIKNVENHINEIEQLFSEDDYDKEQIVQILEDAVTGFKHLESP